MCIKLTTDSKFTTRTGSSTEGSFGTLWAQNIAAILSYASENWKATEEHLNLGCRKWVLKVSALLSWKSAETGFFCTFSAFFGFFRRARTAPGNSRKRRKKAFFLRLPPIRLSPHLLNPHLRHSNKSCGGPESEFFECDFAPLASHPFSSRSSPLFPLQASSPVPSLTSFSPLHLLPFLPPGKLWFRYPSDLGTPLSFLSLFFWNSLFFGPARKSLFFWAFFPSFPGILGVQ